MKRQFFLRRNLGGETEGGEEGAFDKKMAWAAWSPPTPSEGLRPKRSSYFILTTIAPMKSPFFQSFLVVLGWLLWQSAQP